jgi:hypothetical protein
MAENRKYLVPKRDMNFDGRAKNSIKSKPPLAELSLKLTNKEGRSLKISGIVPEGRGLEAAPSVVRQNGGVCVVEGEYLKMISFPSLGFEVEFPQFYKKGGLPFKIENGEVVWSSLADTKIKGKTFMEIKDDRQYTEDMPDIISKVKGFLLRKRKKCEGGGCGGSKEEEDILSSPALALALANPDLEFSYDPNKGNISILTQLIRDEFIYTDEFSSKPGDPPDMGFAMPQPVALPPFYEPSSTDNDCIGKTSITNEREVYRRERLEVEDKISTVFFEYSKNYLSRVSQQKRVTDCMIGCKLPGVIAKYSQEESMIMRLLMNPTERKIWGKMYGLPDEDDSRERFYVKNPKIKEISTAGCVTEGVTYHKEKRPMAVIPESTKKYLRNNMNLCDPKLPGSSHPKTKPVTKPMIRKGRTNEFPSSRSFKAPKQRRNTETKILNKDESKKKNSTARTPKLKPKKFRRKDSLRIEIPPDNKLKRKKSKLSKADIPMGKTKANPKDKKGKPDVARKPRSKRVRDNLVEKTKQKTRSKVERKTKRDLLKVSEAKVNKRKRRKKPRVKSKRKVNEELLGLFRKRSGARSSRQRQSM